MADEVPPLVFIKRVWNAILRIGAAILFGYIHLWMQRWFPYIVPENIKNGRLWLEDIAFVAFTLVLVFLLWDMVKIFAPSLNRKEYPGVPNVVDAVEVKDEA